MKAKRIGDIVTVENKDRKFAAAPKYNYFRLQKEDGEEIELLATDEDMRRMQERANKNREDLPEIGWLRDLVD